MAAFLVSLVVAMLASLSGEGLVSPKRIEKNAYDIPMDEGESSTQNVQSHEPQDIKSLLAKADIAQGEKTFKKCLQCHSIEKGGAHKTGPNLWNIVGNKLAHVPDFAYSEALKQKGGQWDIDALNHFLYKPRDFIKGTKMSFVGLSDAQERANLIAYLAHHGENPSQLNK